MPSKSHRVLGDRWMLQNDAKHPGFSGKGYIAETASAAIARFAPSKTISVAQPGKHNVWIRAYLGGLPDQGIHDRELIVQVNDKVFEATHKGQRWLLSIVPNLEAIRSGRRLSRCAGRDDRRRCHRPHRLGEALAGVACFERVGVERGLITHHMESMHVSPRAFLQQSMDWLEGCENLPVIGIVFR